MKKIVPIGITLLILFMVFCTVDTLRQAATPTAAPTPTPRPMPAGAYLGETPPDYVPKLFGYRFMGNHLHTPPVFTADGSEVYWGAYNDNGSVIRTMRLVDGAWTPVELLSLSEELKVIGDPSLSPDGKSLFFMARKPALDAPVQSREFIWMAERDGSTWVNPQPLPDEHQRAQDALVDLDLAQRRPLLRCRQRIDRRYLRLPQGGWRIYAADPAGCAGEYPRGL